MTQFFDGLPSHGKKEGDNDDLEFVLFISMPVYSVQMCGYVSGVFPHRGRGK